MDLITASPCYTTKRETETETDTETDRQRQTHRERQSDRDTPRDRQRQKQSRGRERDRDNTESETGRERDRQTERERESYLHSLQSQERLAAVLNQVSRVGYELAEMITKGCGYDLVDVSLVAFHQRLYCLHAR